MSFFFKISIFLCITLSIVIGLFIALKRQREDLAYHQVFLWFISPFTIIAGMIFLDKDHKKRYFQKIKSHLFMND